MSKVFISKLKFNSKLKFDLSYTISMLCHLSMCNTLTNITFNSFQETRFFSCNMLASFSSVFLWKMIIITIQTLLVMLTSRKFSHRDPCVCMIRGIPSDADKNNLLFLGQLEICGGCPSAIKHSWALLYVSYMASIDLAQREAIRLLKSSIRCLCNNVVGCGVKED